jgi:hypothetical protein
MKHYFIALAVCISHSIFGQVKQDRQVAEFTGISCASGITVQLTQGETNAVSVNASSEEAVAKIITEVDKNGVLNIYYKRETKNWKSTKNLKLEAFVTFKSINKLVATSGSLVSTTNQINTTNLMVDANSGANLKATIKATDLKIDVNSGSVSTLKGSATNLKISASSGANFKGVEFNIVNCTADASSGSIIRIAVETELSASVSSGAIIEYKGNPTLAKQSKSSGGEIKKL